MSGGLLIRYVTLARVGRALLPPLPVPRWERNHQMFVDSLVGSHYPENRKPSSPRWSRLCCTGRNQHWPRRPHLRRESYQFSSWSSMNGAVPMSTALVTPQACLLLPSLAGREFWQLTSVT